MVTNPERFTKTIQAFDKANAEDPHSVIVEGKSFPREVIYAKRMSEWLFKAYPNASEVLQLASRCQHIGRWKIARDTYPNGRVGYIQWRNELKVLHAETASAIVLDNGYDEELAKRLSFLVQKKNLRKDEETQALEDVICLVFLEHYFEDFASKHDEAKIIDIVQKTWKKMSTHAHDLALTVNYPEHIASILKKALVE